MAKTGPRLSARAYSRKGGGTIGRAYPIRAKRLESLGPGGFPVTPS